MDAKADLPQYEEHCRCRKMSSWTAEQAEQVLGAVRESGILAVWDHPVWVEDLGTGPTLTTWPIPPFAIRRDVHMAMHKAVVLLGIEKHTDCPSYDMEET